MPCEACSTSAAVSLPPIFCPPNQRTILQNYDGQRRMSKDKKSWITTNFTMLCEWRRTMVDKTLAEGVGFEPTIRFPVYTLSKRAPSATRPSLRVRCQRSEKSQQIPSSDI